VAGVGAVLDFAADSRPVLLERVVTLDQRLQLEAFGGVANLGAPKHPETAIDVLASNRGLDLLDAQKILLVERAQALEPSLELLQRDVDLLVLHGFLYARARPSRKGDDGQIVEAQPDVPVVETKVLVARSA
jgi:hypothetical protein